MTNPLTSRILGYALAFFLAATSIGPLLTAAQEKDGAGVVASGKATAKDVGLPIYPGSKPHKDKDEDSSAANLGLWGGGAGFKLAILKLETSDSPEKVAVFYKRALAKYGNVLDCTNNSGVRRDDKDDSSKTLACGDDKPEKGGLLYKVGTKEKQHIVSIQPNGQGAVYQLVNVGSWGTK